MGCGRGGGWGKNVNDWKVGMGIGWEEEEQKEEEGMHRRHDGRTKKEKE